VYLARYAFDGDPAELEAGYRSLLANLGDAIQLQLAVRRRDGIDVYDACPNEAEFVAFTTNAEFRSALTGAGLPAPRIDGLGDIVNLVDTAAHQSAG
jgi:hypothetical protein